MITEISIKGFKSLHDVDRLSLGQFNLLIGPNASGKSNFLDVFRVLQGIGYGLTINEIFNGKPKSAMGESWAGIRGGARYAKQWQGQAGFDDGVTMHWHKSIIAITVKAVIADSRIVEYAVSVEPELGLVVSESLHVAGHLVFEHVARDDGSAPEVFIHIGSSASSRVVKFELGTPILSQYARRSAAIGDDESAAKALCGGFGSLQTLDPRADELKKYSSSNEAQRIGERGEDFAALIDTICKSPDDKSALVGWLGELRPDEIKDVTTIKGAVGDRMFAIVEQAGIMPATVLSDGTLRFAALVAAFLQPDMPATMAIEEIENGIHASRMRLLIELLRTQTARTGVQVFATTHSPIVLAWLKPEEYRNVLWFKRDESGATRITPLDQDPDVAEVLRKQPIAGLFAEGWLEGVM